MPVEDLPQEEKRRRKERQKKGKKEREGRQKNKGAGRENGRALPFIFSHFRRNRVQFRRTPLSGDVCGWRAAFSLSCSCSRRDFSFPENQTHEAT
jgi:hypothetical protein